MKFKIFSLGVLFISQACSTQSSEMEKAYVPVYKSFEEVAKIDFDKNKKLNKTGKIYIIGQYLLVSEPREGVHIFDNTNPENPERINFISIPENQDMEVKGGLLYVDNGLDLVTIDIRDVENPVVKDRAKEVFPYPYYPPFENVKFVCPDPEKGLVVDWTLEEVENPKCNR